MFFISLEHDLVEISERVIKCLVNEPFSIAMSNALLYRELSKVKAMLSASKNEGHLEHGYSGRRDHHFWGC